MAVVTLVGTNPAVVALGCSGTNCPTMQLRETAYNGSAYVRTLVAEYWGVASGTLSSASMTLTWSGTVTQVILALEGFTNVDTSTPFAVSAPTVGWGSGTAPATSAALVSSNSNIALVGLEGDQTGSSSATPAAGWTSVNLAYNSTLFSSSSALEFEGMAAGCPSGCAVGFSDTRTSWVIIGDAINSPTSAPSSVPELPYGVIPLALALPLVYYALSRRRSAPSTARSEGSEARGWPVSAAEP